MTNPEREERINILSDLDSIIRESQHPINKVFFDTMKLNMVEEREQLEREKS